MRVAANVYAVHGTDVTRPEPIPIAYGDATYPQRRLDGLSFSDAFRTNVGLVNLGDKEASFTLALQRVSGRNIAVARVTLPPNSLLHQSVQALFPVITRGDDFTVVVETASPSTYVYASVIDNATSNVVKVFQSNGQWYQVNTAGQVWTLPGANAKNVTGQVAVPSGTTTSSTGGWTVISGSAALNGVIDYATSNVVGVFQSNGQWYQLNTAGQVWTLPGVNAKNVTGQVIAPNTFSSVGVGA